MTILSAQTIRKRKLIHPLLERQQHRESGCSFGLSAAGYDVRVDQSLILNHGDFVLASTMERFTMPDDVVGIVHDKSTWARIGLAVQNTVIEPGWRGFLTLEITNHGERDNIRLLPGTPIAQVIFHFLDEPTSQPYPERGKYQNQERGAQAARDGYGHA